MLYNCTVILYKSNMSHGNCNVCFFVNQKSSHKTKLMQHSFENQYIKTKNLQHTLKLHIEEEDGLRTYAQK